MTDEEEYFQKIIITSKSLVIKGHLDSTRSFLNMYNALLQDAIAWNSFDEEFYTLVIKQINDQLDYKKVTKWDGK